MNKQLRMLLSALYDQSRRVMMRIASRLLILAGFGFLNASQAQDAGPKPGATASICGKLQVIGDEGNLQAAYIDAFGFRWAVSLEDTPTDLLKQLSQKRDQWMKVKLNVNKVTNVNGVPQVIGRPVDLASLEQSAQSPSVSLEITGELDKSVVAAGGETSGMRVKAAGKWWELGNLTGEIKSQIKALDAKKVTVEGQLKPLPGPARTGVPVLVPDKVLKVE
jgi:hypothetical protein